MDTTGSKLIGECILCRIFWSNSLSSARYFVSTQLPVILYALVMMLMLCTALSFDYSLFTMTRYGEERRKGASLEDSIAAWQRQA